MVIFLAAVLDVPQHLYESAELDGAGPLQRLRCVTLPTISPVILFAVVLGVIQGLQYFTQAYVAGEHRGRAGVAGGRHAATHSATREDSTLFYPVLLYQHGFNDFQMGYASALAMVLLLVSFAVTLMIVLNSRKWVHQAVPAVTAAARHRRAPSRAGARPRRVRRKRFLLAVAQAQPADRRRDRVPGAVRLHPADVADDERARRSRRSSGRIRSARELRRRLHQGAAVALDVQHAASTRRSPRSACSCRASPSPTRSRGCAGAAAMPRSWSC